MPKLVFTCSVFLAALLSTAGATVWLGAEAGSGGYGVHAGRSLLALPRLGALRLGALGVEGSYQQGWAQSQSTERRYAAALTLRDLNLPLTRVDAFASAGVEYRQNPQAGGLNLYAETGLRGPLLGPVGWRAYARGKVLGRSTFSGFGAGVGLEMRF